VLHSQVLLFYPGFHLWSRVVASDLNNEDAGQAWITKIFIFDNISLFKYNLLTVKKMMKKNWRDAKKEKKQEKRASVA